MNKESLQKILDNHTKWLNDKDGGVRADLRGADLSGAYLDADIFCLDRIGSRKGRTVYDATNDRVWCGCFKGTFAEWCAKIKETYPDKNSRYRREYEAAIKYFRELAKIAKCEAALKGGAK